MEKLDVCSICNKENCKEKPYTEEGNFNEVIYAEICKLRHSVHRIGCKSNDRDVINALRVITDGIDKLEILSYGSNKGGGGAHSSTEKKRLEKVNCSNCNKAVELTEKNCHSVFSQETEQIENYFFCKFCQKMISYKKI